MKETKIRPLSMVNNGQKGTILTLTGGRTFHERFVSMGLHIGSEIEVLNCGHHNAPIMLATGDTRLAIGCDMAEKILIAIQKPARCFSRRKREGWMWPFVRKVWST